MPPRPALSTPLRAWKCPSCRTTSRPFSLTTPRPAIGPEHPRYIPFREPPQPGNIEHKFIKGRLPVPRNVFDRAHNREDKSGDDWITRATPAPSKSQALQPAEGSREAWKAKVSAMRRSNMRSGLKALKVRQIGEQKRLLARSEKTMAERRELLERPEREEDRLTAPSHGLDLDTLLRGGPLPDPTREARLKFKKANFARHEALKREKRFEAVNTLFYHAKDFIVTQQQLDDAVEEVFGSEDDPKQFLGAITLDSDETLSSGSVWAKGMPDNVQTMLAKANAAPSGRSAVVGSLPSEINRNRVTQIAEILTGAKMPPPESKDASDR